MKPVGDFFEVSVADIIIPDFRQREKAEPDDALLTSIRERGLMMPIILKQEEKEGKDTLVLVAGERRLRAHMKLELPTILARLYHKLSPVEQYEAELQENLARQQLTWQETVRAVGLYHALREAVNSQNGGGWTQMGTATALGMTQGHTSKLLAVFADIDDDEVAACPTLNGAYNLIVGRAQRAKIAAQSRGLIAADVTTTLLPQTPIGASPAERTAALMAALKTENLAAKTVEEIDVNIRDIQEGKQAAALLQAERNREIVSDLVVCADFLEWAAEYSGPKFDVLHIDFPWGKDYSGPRSRKTGKATINPLYADNPDIYFGLVDGFLSLQDRIAFPAAHCLFWLDMRYYAWTIEQFVAGGWSLVSDYPYIWGKGHQGIASDVKRRPRHCYEAALMFSRGDRKIVKLDRDYSEHNLDPEKLHLNQKPIQMLKHFLGIFVDEHTAVLDPTCGSGTSLAAAKLLGASRVLGIELDPNNADIAKFMLQRNLPASGDTAKDADDGASS